MTRRASKVDRNQPEIVSALRLVGAHVAFLHTMGGGVPDLLVGFRGKNYLLEVKDGSLPPSGRRLTPDQKVWHSVWTGQVSVVSSVSEALEAIGIKGQQTP